MHREPRAEDHPAEDLFEEDKDLGGWVIRWDKWPLLDKKRLFCHLFKLRKFQNYGRNMTSLDI